MHPLQLRRLQMLQILLQRPLIKLRQKWRVRGWIQFTDPINQLTFTHSMLTFGSVGRPFLSAIHWYVFDDPSYAIGNLNART